MKVEATPIPGVLVIEPRVFEDARGCFFESFNHAAFAAAVGGPVGFVQDNHSVSRGPVLRGLHYQSSRPQGKLVRVVAGSVYDVAVDIRPGSPTRGAWFGVELSAANRRQLWIPPGLAHGFLVTSPVAEVLYKTTDYYDPSSERCIIWNDPTLGIAWPLTGDPIVSAKDARGARYAEVGPGVGGP
jgi:dTDP-4-dehydrorhamnose 3,5-epimerase